MDHMTPPQIDPLVANFAARLEKCLEGHSYLDVDFMLRSHIQDFFGCLAEGCLDSESVVNWAMSLCELSREIRLAVASAGNIPDDLCKIVQEMFCFAATQIRATQRPELMQYADNINERVDKLLSAPAASSGRSSPAPR
jgi:hypothetical protein